MSQRPEGIYIESVWSNIGHCYVISAMRVEAGLNDSEVHGIRHPSLPDGLREMADWIEEQP